MTLSEQSASVPDKSPTPSKFAFALILFTVFLDTIGFGIIIPVTPALILELTGKGLGDAAMYGGWLLVLYAIMQFIFAPIIGNLSDHFDRRPVLLFSLFAFGVDYLIMGFAPTLVWLFVGRLLAGIAGGSYVSANAYIADITEPDKRAGRFGMIGAAWGLGFILGPVIGGLLGEFGSTCAILRWCWNRCNHPYLWLFRIARKPHPGQTSGVYLGSRKRPWYPEVHAEIPGRIRVVRHPRAVSDGS